ncbi:hypothetical protein CDL12_23639 [Handroanthus impetiginosus]|uniref:Uncharacterized protein n=1 Tax=Handroanthus impetiginosus TaxID=429701 RepID=A0A2G9GF73_9LAMI|nr:hypothetical protein CDL12_23639 [Handroanthus impetiginosus]
MHSLQDLSAVENEKQDEFLPLDEEKLMMNELVNEDNMSYDLEKVLLDNEAKENDNTDQIGSSKFLESNPSEELKDINKVTEVLNEVGSVQSISMAQNQEEEKPTVENSESEMSIIEECVTRSQSLLEIEKVNEFELAEGETRPILDERESKGNESKEKLGVESNLCHNDHKVELKKSPSFDFGIPLDPKSQESDQTPLLYQDRPPMRSFSSCSGMRFQDRSVQTEYLGKSLHYETVEVEEKTIRMERSHSESIRTVAKEKQGHLDEDCDVISPKGNGKRKPRSSLFTTCICCTAAIS